MGEYRDKYLLREQVERGENWRTFVHDGSIPDLHFDPNWKVRITPPFAGALGCELLAY